jgi:hypothetical protein
MRKPCNRFSCGCGSRRNKPEPTAGHGWPHARPDHGCGNVPCRRGIRTTGKGCARHLRCQCGAPCRARERLGRGGYRGRSVRQRDDRRAYSCPPSWIAPTGAGNAEPALFEAYRNSLSMGWTNGINWRKRQGSGTLAESLALALPARNGTRKLPKSADPLPPGTGATIG